MALSVSVSEKTIKINWLGHAYFLCNLLSAVIVKVVVCSFTLHFLCKWSCEVLHRLNKFDSAVLQPNVIACDLAGVKNVFSHFCTTCNDDKIWEDYLLVYININELKQFHLHC